MNFSQLCVLYRRIIANGPNVLRLRDPFLAHNVKCCVRDIHSDRSISESCQLLAPAAIVLRLASAQAVL